MSQSQLMQLFSGGVGQMGGLSSLLGTIRGPNSGSARTTTPAITHRTTAAVPSTPTATGASANSQSTPSTGLSTPQTGITTVTPSAPSKPKGGSRQTSEATPPTGSGTGGVSGNNSNPIQLSDLQNFLQAIAPPGSEGAAPQQSGKISEIDGCMI